MRGQTARRLRSYVYGQESTHSRSYTYHLMKVTETKLPNPILPGGPEVMVRTEKYTVEADLKRRQYKALKRRFKSDFAALKEVR